MTDYLIFKWEFLFKLFIHNFKYSKLLKVGIKIENIVKLICKMVSYYFQCQHKT